MKVFTLPEMESLARGLAKRLEPGDVIALKGEVGAGKTSFARALIGAIAKGAPDVTSPTFNLMQSYDVATGTLWHLDLYRIEDARELEQLGLDDLWEHIVLIEWPEVAESLLPKDRLTITITFGNSDASRSLALNGNVAWREKLAGLL